MSDDYEYQHYLRDAIRRTIIDDLTESLETDGARGIYSDDSAAWNRSGWEAAIGRAENAERERDEALRRHKALREWLPAAVCESLDFTPSSMLGEAVTAAVQDTLDRNDEGDKETWKQRYTDLLGRAGRLQRAWLGHKCHSDACTAAHREHAEALGNLLPDEEGDR